MLICGVYFILNKEDFSFLEMNIVWVYSLALKDKKNKRYDTTCKECRKDENKEWHINNHEKSLENKKKWHEENRESNLIKFKRI